MSDTVVINGAILEKDAEDTWQAGADTLEKMAQAIPEISAPDFSIMPGGQEAAKLYVTARQALAEYITGGKDEFLAFEHLLLKAAIAYGKAHGATVDEITRMEKELES
ncbi:hypothetical protein LLS1_22420 [Leifsonia sp. LS1]|uniref:hypothetical protein n=1 Tax=unclassified Leifsonia TaxID=2663824 RepID=UPI001CBFE0CE|nr:MULTISPECIES: hypothetical protein [unclassified Leifsonia]UAJ78283.1 hypothetical protein IT072_13545 [Leifsonia sp. ZF2019]GIT80573.1 hypothetical protein LLS1_22420 [Leifsonia sp. LS1]